MTTYRTVVPGMQDENDATHLNQQTGRSNSGQRSYSADGMDSNASGTRIPGMENQSYRSDNQQDAMTGKPIVGFLISVSRTEEGEYWVLRQGQNTIGSGTTCNVVLSEASVSGLHAVLAIHRNPGDNNRLSVGVMDRGSSNGVFVNGNYIGFNPWQCKIFDKIRIGNYELLLMLFDPIDFEMKKAANFIAKNENDFDYTDRERYTSNDGTKF